MSWLWPICTGAENLASTGIQSPDHPACSELLYRLHYLLSPYSEQWLSIPYSAAVNTWSVHYTTTTPIMLITSCLEFFFSAMATDNNLPLFWNSGFQFFLQHDIYLSVLPYAGGRFIPRTYCWFCDDVSLWRNLYDCILTVPKTEPWVFRHSSFMG